MPDQQASKAGPVQAAADTSSDEEKVQGFIFDIKQFAVHDGPGIRTTVLFKGCPLRCLWCHNPEGASEEPQLFYDPAKCIGCGHCVAVCVRGAHSFEDGHHLIDRNLCEQCGACAEGCYAHALELAGRQVSVAGVLEEVLRDRPFFERSGGGVTLSGGEPTAQYEFARALLKAVKAQGIHTALDTAGFVVWKRLEGLLAHTDLVLYDLKQMNSEQHRRLTGVPNELILANLRRIDNAGYPVWVRIPLIPGQNDDDANLHAVGRFLADLKCVERVDILRYHAFAESKYEQLGLEYPLAGLRSPSNEHARSRQEILVNYGLHHVTVS